VWKTPTILLAILMVLFYWDATLSRREADTRRSSSQVRQLIPPGKREGKLVAAIQVEEPSRKESSLYGHVRGSWRCLSLWGVMADEARIRGLLEKLFNAQGIVQSRDRARMPDYGLDEKNVLRLSLHGPRILERRGRDVLQSFDVGFPVPGGNGCYVRVSGSDEVIAIDENLREELARPEESTLPPLLDPHVIPAIWPGKAGIRRISIEREDGEKFEIARRDKSLSPDELRAGKIPWDWILRKDGNEVTCDPLVSTAYVMFLQRAPYTALIDPRTLPDLGLDKPSARLILRSPEGEGQEGGSPLGSGALEIAIGRKGSGPGSGSGVPVENRLTQNLFEVSSEVAGLMAPRSEQLTRADRANPWEPWLRR